MSASATHHSRQGRRNYWGLASAFLERRPLQRTALYLAAPLIYLMIIPLLFLDLCAELYQQLVFRLLGIPLLKRRHYMRFDRHRLEYLNAVQKLGCTYCAYANGLLRYAGRIAAETEKFFCPIQHLPGGIFLPPAHHAEFVPYGDRKGFAARLAQRDQ